MDVHPDQDVSDLASALHRAQWVIDMAFEQNGRLRQRLSQLETYASRTGHMNNVNTDILDRLQDRMAAHRAAVEKQHATFHGNVHISACSHDICREATRIDD